MSTGANQDRFLGALLGMAIGDAMGMPIAGWSEEQVHDRLGRVDAFHRRVLPDGAEIKPGEFTDETEIALCIVESITTNQGTVDPDNIGARMLFLARGESRRWMGRETLAALERAELSRNFVVPIDEDGAATGDVAARGVPIGLLHAPGPFRPADLRSDAEAVTRLTHGSPSVISATTAVAFGLRLAAGTDTSPSEWIGLTADFLGEGEAADGLNEAKRQLTSGMTPADVMRRIGTGEPAAEVVPGAFAAVLTGGQFEDVVETAVSGGGAADSRGAIAGALAGARVGAAGIPQRLIDDLEGRIYVSLAAPWFHQTAMTRLGGVVRLEPRG